MNVGYLTSGQYHNYLVHFFQTREISPSSTGGASTQSNNKMGSVYFPSPVSLKPSERRVIALLDDTTRYNIAKVQQQRGELHILTSRCAAMSRVEVMRFESEPEAKAVRSALVHATEYDVLAQSSTMLDFVRILNGIFTLDAAAAGNRMVLVRLSQHQPDPQREVFVAQADVPETATTGDVRQQQQRIDALLTERARTQETHLSELVNMRTALEAANHRAQDCDRALRSFQEKARRTEESLRAEIARLERIQTVPKNYLEQQQHRATMSMAPPQSQPLPFESKFDELMRQRSARRQQDAQSSLILPAAAAFCSVSSPCQYQYPSGAVSSPPVNALKSPATKPTHLI
eukprot:PhM_4_TR5417/c0_g1_i1/m.14296